MVDLNIGGERMVMVARSTLTLVGDSMLGAMFSGRHKLKTDDTGKVVLDRDPKFFGYILDYLRNGGQVPANLPKDEGELQRVQQEFDYFLLPLDLTPPPKSLAAMFAERAFSERTLQSGVSHLEDRRVVSVDVSGRYVVIAHRLSDEHDDAANSGSTVEAWDLVDSRHMFLEKLSDEARPRNLCIFDEAVAAITTDNSLAVWDLRRGGRVIKTLTVQAEEGERVFDDGDDIQMSYAYLGASSISRQCVYVWDRHTWQQARVMTTTEYPYAFMLHESELVYLRDPGVVVYDLEAKRETHSWTSDRPSGYTGIDSSGAIVVCYVYDTDANESDSGHMVFDICDMNTHARMKRLTLAYPVPKPDWIRCTAGTIILACDNALRLVDIATGEVTVPHDFFKDYVSVWNRRLVSIPPHWPANTPKTVVLYEPQ